MDKRKDPRMDEALGLLGNAHTPKEQWAARRAFFAAHGWPWTASDEFLAREDFGPEPQDD